ncbi:hypothetical protein PYW07_006653 [Mythimna separata]|uniref:PHD-type domain-containing protein n=1 Tax=Mythimna separata TaxID=271217 RepID=A0AAD8DWP4_MYTSE|nr:hypothetical protein PYW07_006653 [Mythimna separata]
MVKCGACGKFLTSTDAAKCDGCRSWYHRQCVGMKKAGTISPSWQCPECEKNIVRDNRSETPVRGRADLLLEDLIDTSPTNTTSSEATQELTLDIRAELKKFKDDIIKSVRSEFLLLRNDLSEMRTSLQSTNERISGLEERVSAIENRKGTQPMSSDVHKLIDQLRSDINDRDQELLATDIQISNLPETSGENPIHTAILVASKIDVKIEARDIVSAERIGGRRINVTQPAPVATRPRFLVVQLARRDLRDEMLEAARSRRGMTSADLGLPGAPARFYVNERLTKTNRELFRMAREAGGRLGWQFVWCKRGRILARCKPGEPASQIRCEADIQRIFEPALAPIVDGQGS